MTTSELIVIPILTGIVSGFVANALYRVFETKKRIRSIRRATTGYIGSYNVFHWRDLQKPDGVGYRVMLTLDQPHQLISLEQTGTEPAHRMLAQVGLNDSTFQFGEGNYSHPEKRGNPTGRIQIFLAGNGIINVDKYYLDDATHQPGYEKWQWRRSD